MHRPIATATLSGCLAAMAPLLTAEEAAASTAAPAPAPVAAAAADTAPASLEDRIAQLEAEVAALRAQLDPETLAKAIAEQVVIAQRKAMEPPSPAEAVEKLSKTVELDEEKKAALTQLLTEQQTAMTDFMSKMRGGEIPREEIRARMTEMRDEYKAKFDELLSEEEQRALREAQQPAMGRRGRGGMGGMGGGNRQGGERGNRQGGNNRAPTGGAEF